MMVRANTNVSCAVFPSSRISWCYRIPPPQSPESREAFAEVFIQLQKPSPPEPSPATPSTETLQQQQPSLGVLSHRPQAQDGNSIGAGGGGARGAGAIKDEADVDFLREM